MGPFARLTPLRASNMMNRTGLFIHGQGRHGSDGRIVPILERRDFQSIMNSLDEDREGSLFVDESIEGYRFA